MMQLSSRRVAAIVAILAITIIGITTGYSSTPNLSSNTQQKSSTPKVVVNRGTFLSTTSAACLTFLSSSTPPAYAKEIDPALKGTKADP